MLEQWSDNYGARHIRGKVGEPVWRTQVRSETGFHGFGSSLVTWKNVRDHYWFEVVNTKTGKVVYRSDEFGHEAAMTECAKRVAIAREAWFMNLRAKDLV